MENSAFIALLNFHFIPRRVTYLVSENILLIINSLVPHNCDMQDAYSEDIIKG